MNFSKTKAISLACGLSLALLAGNAVAHMGDFAGKPMMRMMAKKLSLTDAQKQAVQDIKQQAKANKATFETQMQTYHQQLNVIMQAETFDEQAFVALNEANRDMFNQLALEKAKTRHAMHQVLTPEQQQKLQGIMEQRKQRRHERFNSLN